MSGSTAAAGLEEGLWLCRIEDRRKLDSPREGMIEGFSLGNSLLLVDYTGRLFREGKAVISAELGAILERLGGSVEDWQARLRKLAGGRLLGRFFAATRARYGKCPVPGRASPCQPGRLRGALSSDGTAKPLHSSKSRSSSLRIFLRLSRCRLASSSGSAGFGSFFLRAIRGRSPER